MRKQQRLDRAAMVSGIAAATGKAQPLSPQSSQVSSRPKSREGLVALTSWHDPAVVKQLKQIALDEGIKQQRLMARALNHLFREFGRPEIAD